ncbi:hypothetical protein DLAC_09947 [Tieghemostelium lacteum]|uniref:Transmembrane protein n=1 Tax=Tieghemostelium lacteum TaxID=361077 RepID=A0A151Z5S4_TIELA|nr:hypothetical protein DLAC_09947 [Tieghemostelium lacteum]|eukprot:KYQ89287.1 hypothetical protein DLAC_09947 [Tieghemostelium lacteum]
MVLTNEQIAQAFIAFATNLSCIPLGYLCIKRGSAYEAVVGVACAIASMMYHIGEVFEDKVWFGLTGLTEGQWHRLDNVFTILVFQCLMFFLMDIQNYQWLEFLRWTFLVFTLYCQEKAPWEVFYTILPIGASFFLMILQHLYKRKVPEWVYNREFHYGLGLLAIAAVFFVRGLDDDNDYLRINHGIWHFFVGFAFYYIFLSRDKALKNVKNY